MSLHNNKLPSLKDQLKAQEDALKAELEAVHKAKKRSVKQS